MGNAPSRRKVLGTFSAASVTLLAGCSSITSSLTGPPPDVVVFNRTNGSTQMTLEITNRSNGNTVTSDTTTINQGEASEYSDALPASGNFAASVTTESGLSGNYKWTVSSEDQSLQVRLHSDSVKFGTASP